MANRQDDVTSASPREQRPGDEDAAPEMNDRNRGRADNESDEEFEDEADDLDDEVEEDEADEGNF